LAAGSLVEMSGSEVSDGGTIVGILDCSFQKEYKG